MGLARESVEKFSELDVEKRIMLLLEYIKVLRGGLVENPKLLENTNVNAALIETYKRIEKEFDN
ncbi:hypothetical protein [Paenibacillus tyrfis]|uniref:Uncharacterized protein n=1 Tax=Paenibacillus tyrfis TaxID=1501230 RepID=A0A081P4E5_9BACL|nr:hypothetical protein [Paenibacillus tyrfis]KEQ25568.1 hypothetical protein ET33_02270 [Paenibacillus tyrfis]